MTTSIAASDADAFAIDWLSAWNSHDLDRIVSHYHADVEYHSPFVARLTGRPRLESIEALREYVQTGLTRYPDLQLGPILHVAPGADSIAIVYRSVEQLLAVETLVRDGDGLIVRVYCHYRAPD